MKDIKNKMKDNLPYEFHTRFKENIRVVMNNILTELHVLCLSTNRGTSLGYTALPAYELHHSEHIAICSMVDVAD